MPVHFNTPLETARQLIKTGKRADAERVLDSVHACYPEDFDAQMGAAGLFNELAAGVEKSIAVKPSRAKEENLRALREKALKAAKAASDWRDANFESAQLTAELSAKLGKAAQAFAYVRRAIEVDDHHERSWNLMAELYAAANEPKRAEYARENARMCRNGTPWLVICSVAKPADGISARPA